MNPDSEQLAHLISGISESLHREMHEGFTRVTDRLDLMEARLNRHGAMLQTGARWSARMTEWSERIDQLQDSREKRIVELERRVRNLERKKNGHK
jgi:hypothetical protein